MGSSLRLEQTEVLVVGGALAGLAAANAAADAGAEVLLLSKGQPGHSGSTLYIGGFITWCPPGQEQLLYDQVRWTGGYLGDPRLVRVLAEGIGEANFRLKGWGLGMTPNEPIDKPTTAELESPPHQPKGYLLGRVMAERAAEQGVCLREGFSVVSLLTTDDGDVCGALAIDQETGEFIAVQAGQTVLATGGGARAFARCDNPRGTTGDGFLLALEAGAALVDMELINFNFEVSDMEEALERGPAAIGDRGTAHYFLGGIRIDEHGRTRVPGLLAAGEVTGGLLGAARLGGSALADCLVFGLRAGEAAAHSSVDGAVESGVFQTIAEAAVSSQCERVAADAGPAVSDVYSRIRQTAWASGGVVKDEGNLRQGLDTLYGLSEMLEDLRVPAAKDLALLLETRSVYYTALASMEAACLRRETRGNFWRSDFPCPDREAGAFRSIVFWDDGRLRAVQRPLPEAMPLNDYPIRIGPGCLGYDFTSGPR